MLETERIYMRKWQESDAPALYELAKDPEVGYPCGWPAHTSVENSLDVIKNVLDGPECYAVVEKGTDRLLGSIELMVNGSTDIIKEADECELGFWIGKEFWGRGLIPEASKELMRHGFEELGMNKIWCRYFIGNEKSKRTQEKLGFVFQYTGYDIPVSMLGETRDEEINLITKEQFYAK